MVELLRQVAAAGAAYMVTEGREQAAEHLRAGKPMPEFFTQFAQDFMEVRSDLIDPVVDKHVRWWKVLLG
jgi:hypothetical protein